MVYNHFPSLPYFGPLFFFLGLYIYVVSVCISILLHLRGHLDQIGTNWPTNYEISHRNLWVGLSCSESEVATSMFLVEGLGVRICFILRSEIRNPSGASRHKALLLTLIEIFANERCDWVPQD